MTTTAVDVPVWRIYRVRVARTTRLSPSFVRVTFAGPDLDEFADNGRDQRCKLLLPARTGGALPPADRPRLVRRVAAAARGPEATAAHLHRARGPARPGRGRHRHGAAWRHRPGVPVRGPGGHVGLPADAHGEAVLEVPDAGDVTDTLAPPGVRVTWVVRQGDVSPLPEAVREAVARLGPIHAVPGADPGDAPDDEPLWDVPEQAGPTGLYAWLAGEASVITGLRRHLVRDLGVDRRGVAFMGYWRRGRAEC